MLESYKLLDLLIKIITLLVGVVLLLYLLTQTTISAPSNMQAKIDEYINAHIKVNHFSGSVLIAQKGKTIISKGYGQANYELDVPNTPQTKFRLGSITKQFTAMAIMQLQERGLLNVNDSLSKYIPNYPEHAQQITLHHLLTHTSGIPNLTSFPDYQETMIIPSPLEQTIARFKDKPLEFTPGEKFSYSNSGYILLTYIIEQVSGKPYESYLQTNIFHPLGMINTGYDHHSIILKNRASGYSLEANGLMNAAYIDMSIPAGAGALYSTVEDLYKWDRALYTEKLVSKAALKDTFTPFKDNYGYGWLIAKLFNNRQVVGHDGGINGFSSSLARYIDDDVFIVVLSNNQNAPLSQINQDLAAIVFGEKYEIPQQRTAIKVDPNIYNFYVGKYELKPNFIITITTENGRIFAQATGQPKLEIYPESETKYFATVVDAQITFVSNESQQVTELILHQRGQNITGRKIN
jgi:CubicO group peptidase (beta-lactamase class C family)